MKNILFGLFVGIVFISILALLTISNNQPIPSNMGAYSENTFSDGVTNSSTTVSTTAVLLISSSTNRVWTAVCEPEGVETYIHFTSTDTDVVAGSGYFLKSACITWGNERMIYKGDVYAIATAGGTHISIQYK